MTRPRGACAASELPRAREPHCLHLGWSVCTSCSFWLLCCPDSSLCAGRTLSVEYVSKEPGGFSAGDGGGSRDRSRSPYGRRRSRSPSYGGARSRSPVRSPRRAPACLLPGRSQPSCHAALCACATLRVRFRHWLVMLRLPLMCVHSVMGVVLALQASAEPQPQPAPQPGAPLVLAQPLARRPGLRAVRPARLPGRITELCGLLGAACTRSGDLAVSCTACACCAGLPRVL